MGSSSQQVPLSFISADYTTDRGDTINLWTISEKELAYYTEQVLKAQVITAETPPPTECPRAVTQEFDHTSDKKFVIIGQHHTALWLNDDERVVKQGSGGTSSTINKLNDIMVHGLKHSPQDDKDLLYGPGTYVTQRPAIGYLAASGFMFEFASKSFCRQQKLSERWAMYMLHLVMPVEEYIKLHAVNVRLVPDQPHDILRRHLNGYNKSDRGSWGLDESDVVVAKNPNTKTGVEEMVFADKSVKTFKTFAEQVDTKVNWNEYNDFRSSWREEKSILGEGQCWSHIAVPALEQGDNEHGYKRHDDPDVDLEDRFFKGIENPPSYRHFSPFYADLAALPAKKVEEGSIWNLYNQLPERDY